MGGDRSSTTSSRRRFLGTAAGATGVALGAAAFGTNRAAAAVVPEGAPQIQAADKRSYVASHFALDLDNTGQIGFLKDVEGGNITAQVVEINLGNGNPPIKHISTLKFEDITLQIDLAMPKPIYDWITASWNQNYQRKSGAIIAADFNYEKKARREFRDALISEVKIPALDASSKEPGYMNVTLTTEETQTKVDSGKIQPAVNTKQKLWTTASFRLEIDGVDCTRVNKIDSFTVKQKIVESQVGEQRIPTREPGKLEFPNLVVTFNSASGPSWLSWFTSFVIQGKNGAGDEKSGRIVFLSSDLKSELAEIKLSGVGIYKLLDGVFDPVSEPSAMMRAELYVERMQFRLPPGAEPPPSP